MHFSIRYHHAKQIDIFYTDDNTIKRVYMKDLYSMNKGCKATVHVDFLNMINTVDDINAVIQYIHPLFYRFYVDLTLKVYYEGKFIMTHHQFVVESLVINSTYFNKGIPQYSCTSCINVGCVEKKREVYDKLAVLADRSTLPKDLVMFIKKFMF